MNTITQRLHPSCFSRKLPGFTLLELVGVLLVLVLAVALLIPNMRFSREAARRMSCSNNFKQIGLGLHNYHTTYKRLPTAMGGTRGLVPGTSNAGRLSGLVPLLPFVEQQALWEQISRGGEFPAMGPEPWDAEFEPWSQQIPTYRCPSSPSEQVDFGFTNYTFCIGDVAQQIHEPDHVRGVFACGHNTRFRDISDGMAHTIAMTEIGTMVDRCIAGQFAVNQPASMLHEPASIHLLGDGKLYLDDCTLSKLGRGGNWADGGAGTALVNTILPPNQPSVAIGGTEAVDGIYAAGSFHQGGAHVLMADGAVVFITESIDAGDAEQSPPSPEQLAGEEIPKSPYGLWGALGTANANDVVEEEF